MTTVQYWIRAGGDDEQMIATDEGGTVPREGQPFEWRHSEGTERLVVHEFCWGNSVIPKYLGPGTSVQRSVHVDVYLQPVRDPAKFATDLLASTFPDRARDLYRTLGEVVATATPVGGNELSRLVPVVVLDEALEVLGRAKRIFEAGP